MTLCRLVAIANVKHLVNYLFFPPFFIYILVFEGNGLSPHISQNIFDNGIFKEFSFQHIGIAPFASPTFFIFPRFFIYTWKLHAMHFHHNTM